MLGQSYFQLLNPLIALTFSGGFLLLWNHARDIRSLLFFAASYLAASCAMIVDFFQYAFVPGLASLLLSTLYLALSVYFCAGLYQLYRNRVPWSALTVAAAAVLILYLLFRFGLDTLMPSAWIINIGTAALYFRALFDLRRDMRTGIHRVLQGVLFASVVAMVLRVAAVFWSVGAPRSAGDYVGSVASVTAQLLLAVASLAVAAVLFIMYGMKILGGLKRSSETDPLTGVLNRRGFEAHAAAIADGIAPETSGHGLVVADMDGFKSVNDRFGHGAGDRVIARIARLLEEAAGDGSLVARWGGEEFVILIPNGGVPLARLYAETVRAAAEAMGHDDLNGEAVTISFGIAEWRPGDTLRTACGRADAALYEAKRAGRNCVRTAVKSASPRLAESVA
jgi:diguanylate cyclase (GGDEF)-like protein